MQRKNKLAPKEAHRRMADFLLNLFWFFLWLSKWVVKRLNRSPSIGQ